MRPQDFNIKRRILNRLEVVSRGLLPELGSNLGIEVTNILSC